MKTLRNTRRSLREEIEFRISKPVTESVYFANGCEYAVCPKCKSTLEREYLNYCDRCGQALDWNKYK